MDVIVKERPSLNLQEFLVFCSCDCSCIRFSLWREEQKQGEPKYIIYANYYSCRGEKAPKHCKTEFEMSLVDMEKIINYIEHGWKSQLLYYNPTSSPRWMTAMVWGVNGDHELIIGFYPKMVGRDEAYQKNKCAAEIILEESEYKAFVASMQSMIDVGKKIQERWRKEHEISSNNKK